MTTYTPDYAARRRRFMKIFLPLAALLVVAIVVGASALAWQSADEAVGSDPAANVAAMSFTIPEAGTTRPAEDGFIEYESGVRYKITEPAGEPKVAQAGDLLFVHYTGKLDNGTVFDSSRNARPGQEFPEPFSVRLGAGGVIPGWEIGLAGMKVGEQRTLVIPPELAYGARGAGGVIPPNATLTFELELVGLARDE
jgi:peptidylprolyl isomerase